MRLTGLTGAIHIAIFGCLLTLVPSAMADTYSYRFQFTAGDIFNAFQAANISGFDSNGEPVTYTMDNTGLFDLYARPVACVSNGNDCWNGVVKNIRIPISPVFTGFGDDPITSWAGGTEMNYDTGQGPSMIGDWARFYDLPVSAGNFGLVAFVASQTYMSSLAGPPVILTDLDPLVLDGQSRAQFALPSSTLFTADVDLSAPLPTGADITWKVQAWGYKAGETKIDTFYLDLHTPTYSSVPEPGACGLVAAGLTGAMLFRRRQSLRRKS